MKHTIIKVYGRVQGVGFRHSARVEAEGIHVTGFARNETDGSVYIEAEGEEKDLEKFLNWCKSGSGFSEVERVESSEREIKGFSDFVIK